MEGMSELVTTGKAAASLGVVPSTLLRWMHEGRVTPALETPGGHLRWSLDDLRSQLGVPAANVAEPGQIEPQPVAAAIVAVEGLGVLLERRRDGRPPWTFPAGELEYGESPADAAVREVKEECELIVRPLRVLGRRVHPSTGRLMIYLACEPAHGTAVGVGDAAELAEVGWCSLAEADERMPGMFGPVRAYLGAVLGETRQGG